jgi:hypothetical protein
VTGPTGPGAGTSTVAAGDGTRNGCDDLPERPDGIYQVGEAGEVEIVREGDTLRLNDETPAVAGVSQQSG